MARTKPWTLVLAALGLQWACGGGGAPGSATTSAGPPSPSPASGPLVWRWRALPAASSLAPDARSHGTAVYDPVGNRLVVFGGQSETQLLNDAWAFDLAVFTWTRLTTLGTPPEPRLGANAVYDPGGHQMVLWAGQQGSRFFNDTWTLDLASLRWRDVSPRDRPQARYGSASVFDPAERRLVQFAGFTDVFRRFQDTQAFDLDTLAWEDLGPPGSRPQVRCLLTAALDAAAQRMIVYGGQQNGPLDDLWAFDLRTRAWTELTPEVRPAARMLASSFVDGERRFVVFGGSTSAGTVNETWAFDLERRQWTRLELADPPPAREAPLFAALDANRFVVFGGAGPRLLNDVWELRRAPLGS